MSAAVATPTLFDQIEERAVQRPVTTAAQPRTLDALVVARWREVCTHGTTVCPICGGEMMRAGGTPRHSGEMTAICGECRTEIS